MLPVVRLTLIDLDIEERERAARFGLGDAASIPFGVEFNFQAFNSVGEMVCSGKLTHVPNSKLGVCHIDTPQPLRRNGYASATLVALTEAFGLPIAPMSPRGEGLMFWPAVRRSLDSAEILESTCLTEMLQETKALPPKDYTPLRAVALVGNRR